MKKILFVFTGNTCRSPMAEGIAKAILAKKGKDDVVLSAGLFTAPGGRVSPFAVEAVKDIADISEHRSRPLTTALIDAADLVVGLSSDHKQVLLRQYPQLADKFTTLGEWAGTNEDVPDPFGGDQEEYKECAKQIRTLLEKAL